MNNVIAAILFIGVFGTIKLIFKTVFGLVWLAVLLALWIGIPALAPLGFPPEGLSFAETFGYACLSALAMIGVVGLFGMACQPFLNWIER